MCVRASESERQRESRSATHLEAEPAEEAALEQLGLVLVQLDAEELRREGGDGEGEVDLLAEAVLALLGRVGVRDAARGVVVLRRRGGGDEGEGRLGGDAGAEVEQAVEEVARELDGEVDEGLERQLRLLGRVVRRVPLRRPPVRRALRPVDHVQVDAAVGHGRGDVHRHRAAHLGRHLAADAHARRGPQAQDARDLDHGVGQPRRRPRPRLVVHAVQLEGQVGVVVHRLVDVDGELGHALEELPLEVARVRHRVVDLHLVELDLDVRRVDDGLVLRERPVVRDRQALLVERDAALVDLARWRCHAVEVDLG